MKIKVSDKIQTKEGLTNYKPWFNGLKKFSSVKVNPAPLGDSSILKINVVDSIASGDKVGG